MAACFRSWLSRRSARPLAGLLLLLGLGCSEPRVLVVGLDGATWRVLDPLIDAGYLPNMADVLSSAATFDLDCVPASAVNPCFCPPVWTTIATGRTARDHHINNFETPSYQRGVKALWNVVRDHGGESRLLAYRGTWPPEPNVGIILTEPGAIAAGLELFDEITGSTHPGLGEPETLTAPVTLLEDLGVLPSPTPPEERLPAWEPFAIDRVSMETLTRQVLVDRERPPEESGLELTMILLHSPDKSEHMSWNWIQAAQWDPINVNALLADAAAWDGPVYKPRPYPWSKVPHQYLEIDEWLGTLLGATDYDYIVFVSDHGMTRSSAGLPGQHSRAYPEAHVGIFAISGPGVVPLERSLVSVLDVAPTVAHLLGLPVGEDLPGRVLVEAFSDDHLATYPVTTVPTWE